ncbi:hypothetical protein QFC22_005868 [Naganishia vaughanmartiniae]|uniref:Uncharacterized protein n=1 Tax=Naganishia vaughanmartiniae TaxID=1424756 RepID=A0ACC2WRI0_9TREE|nr:hypothetical protein QFC22_005868 [Naganishia vaughanmartiniae]
MNNVPQTGSTAYENSPPWASGQTPADLYNIPQTSSSQGASLNGPTMASPPMPDNNGTQPLLDAQLACGSFSPNTQAILCDFVGLPTPIFEGSYDFGNYDSNAPFPSMEQPGLMQMSPMDDQVAQRATSMMEVDNAGFNVPDLFLPTGFNLWEMPSPFGQAGTSFDMYPPAADPALDTHLRKLTLLSESSTSQNPLFSADGSEITVLSPDEQDSGDWEDISMFITGKITMDRPRHTLPPQEGKKLIDVPPFLRQKLLNSYWYHIKRFATLHTDRLHFREELNKGLESELHPSFVFAVYMTGAAWHEESAIRDLQNHFFETAKTELYNGMSDGDRYLDLIRAAMDMVIYLLAKGKKKVATIYGNQASLIMVWRRPSAFESQAVFPLSINYELEYTTLQDILDGGELDMGPCQEPASAPMMLALALATYAYELGFSCTASIGDKGTKARAAIVRMKTSMPASWRDYATMKAPRNGASAVPEKYILMCITALLDLAEAFLYQLEGPPSNHQVVYFARKVISNICLLENEDDYARVPMHAQMYWSHSVNMLTDEMERLKKIGSVDEVQQLEKEIEMTHKALSKLSRAYLSG